VAGALTVLACVVGVFGWPAPARTSSGWQVADVPPPLLALLLGIAAVSLAVGTLLVRPSSLGAVGAAAWWLLGLASLFAQVWNDLYFAALRDGGGGAVIPVFGWLFTFVPALVLGLTTRRTGRAAHLRATLGTGIVTLPLLGLGWALYGSAEGGGAALVGSLYSATLLGALPLLVALALTRPPGTPMPAPAGA
jgi:hypothetical protein